jgi:hypothetical protein
VSAAELDEGTIQRLMPLAEADHVAVLLGAGASAAAGLPDWDGLAAQLLHLSGAINDESTARAFLARQDAALAAEAARAVAPGDWLGLVRSALYPDAVGEPEPAALHLAVAALAAQRPVGDVGLFTLNFDLLIERALQGALDELDLDAGIHVRDTEDSRAGRGDFEVQHLHGYLGHDPDETGEVILTLSDFTRLSAQAQPWQVSALQEALTYGPLLLAGTSYRDADIRQWMHELKLNQRPGKAFILLARESLGLSRQQFDGVQEALVTQWGAIGVSAVLVQDHGDAAQAIREVTYLSDPDRAASYAAPAQRAGRLWSTVRDQFDELQREHSDQIAEDLTHLRSVLGPEANLTLWLADGQGNIVRWCSHDRLYRQADLLKSVVVGHDSPWIAGQCLGRSDILARDLTEGTATGRWRSVVAAPSVAGLAGGPPLPVAVLSSAAPTELSQLNQDEWVAQLTLLAEQWAERLSTLTGA